MDDRPPPSSRRPLVSSANWTRPERSPGEKTMARRTTGAPQRPLDTRPLLLVHRAELTVHDTELSRFLAERAKLEGVRDLQVAFAPDRLRVSLDYDLNRLGLRRVSGRIVFRLEPLDVGRQTLTLAAESFDLKPAATGFASAASLIAVGAARAVAGNQILEAVLKALAGPLDPLGVSVDPGRHTLVVRVAEIAARVEPLVGGLRLDEVRALSGELRLVKT